MAAAVIIRWGRLIPGVIGISPKDSILKDMDEFVLTLQFSISVLTGRKCTREGAFGETINEQPARKCVLVTPLMERLLDLFAVTDMVKPEAEHVISRSYLHSMGISTSQASW
ncbi:hypothetical protein V6N12_034057 [Hibiscus sabdariffa]|uniref:Rho-GAP domain-containing protein n=1 Tax=Hibiscus sabdariffa TaxID=183260 RepID=A0ABR2BIK0_9ROSI